jgi:hypothetical protein
MKKVILSLALLAGFTASKAQGSLEKGKAQINAGFGLSNHGIPVVLGLDYAVTKAITIGAEVSYRSYKNSGYNFGITSICANANYHFDEILDMPKKWDIYAGLNIGYIIWNTPNNYIGSYSSGLGLGGQIGGRYFFTNRIGANLEVAGGNTISGGKVGLTFKL